MSAPGLGEGLRRVADLVVGDVVVNDAHDRHRITAIDRVKNEGHDEYDPVETPELVRLHLSGRWTGWYVYSPDESLIVVA